MIVECGSCQTRFQLDPSRIPLRGIRVRCSHCKTAFFLPHPDATPAEADDEVAEEAARDATTAPHATRDLASEPESDAHDSDQYDPADGEDDGEVDVEVDVDVDVEDADEDVEDEEPEEEWEFNRVPAEPEPEPDSAFDVAAVSESSEDSVDYSDEEDEISDPDGHPDWTSDASSDPEEAASDWGELAASAAGEGGFGLELSADEEGLSIDLSDAGSSQLDSEFGEAPDFSASADDDSSDDGSPKPEPEEAGLFGAIDQDLRADRDPVEAAAPAGEETVGPPGVGHSADRAPESAQQADDREQRPQRLPASAGPGMSRIAPARAPSRTLATLRSALGAVGWGITLSLLGVGLAWGLLKASSPSTAGPERVVLGDFYVEGVRTGWLETARAGVVYTVSGRLVNAARVSRRPESYLQAALVGSGGSRLDVPAAIAGAPLPPGYLRELAVPELRAASVDATARLAGSRLAPGAGSDFLAYFVDLPPEAEGFVLEMAPLPPDQPAPGAIDAAATDPAEAERMDPASP